MKFTVVLAVASLAVANGFAMQPSAFVARAAGSQPCDVIMASRMNTKREKFFRNLEVCRATPRGRRRAVVAASCCQREARGEGLSRARLCVWRRSWAYPCCQ